MLFLGTALIPTPNPFLQEVTPMLTLFFFWWLISQPWKAESQSPSESVPWLLLASYNHTFLCCPKAKTHSWALHTLIMGLGSRPGSGVQRKEDMGQMDWLQVGTLQHHPLGRQ